MFNLTRFTKIWPWVTSAFFAVVFVQVLARVAIAAEGESPGPALLSSLAIFNIFVYGSIISLAIATLAILGIWVSEMKDGSAW